LDFGCIDVWVPEFNELELNVYGSQRSGELNSNVKTQDGQRALAATTTRELVQKGLHGGNDFA
jgi:hypothetical protein